MAGAVLLVLLAATNELTARRSAAEAAQRQFALEVQKRASSAAKALAHLRAEAAFLAHSPVLEPPLDDRGNPVFLRFAAEAAIILFLRAHPDVDTLTVEVGPLTLRATRRGGVPLVWTGAAASDGGVANRLALRTSLTLRDGGRLVLDVSRSELVRAIAGESATPCSCTLTPTPGATEAAKDQLVATAWIPADGFGVGAPWQLTCRMARGDALRFLASRPRVAGYVDGMLVLLAMVLAALGHQESRRRSLLEERTSVLQRLRDQERRLHHADRLAAVGRLAAGVAHEINNPLEGMSNYLALAREDLVRGDRDAALRRLSSVEKGLGMVAGITRRVLQQARPHEPVLHAVDVAASVDRVAAILEERDGAGLTQRVPPGTMALADDVMLDQVLLNLLRNAAEAQPAGLVEIAVAAQRIDGAVTIEVADRGTGVPEDVADQIFEPFASTKGSSGLGLAVCHALMAEMQGSISYRPRPGGGSIFSLTLQEAKE